MIKNSHPETDEVKEKPHKKFLGTLSQESYDEITHALQDTQRVDDELPINKMKIGFLKDLPPLPDSFFDPMTEEELQLWEQDIFP